MMDKQQKIILTVVGILLAVAVVATVIVFFVTRSGSNFTPPEFDTTAKQGYPTVTDNAAQFQRVTSEDFAFSMCLCPLYESGTARMCFASEITNRAYLLIKLYDADGNVIGQSGLVKPGQYVETVTVSLTPTEDTDISAKIFSYEPNTYYSMGTVSGELNLRVE